MVTLVLLEGLKVYCSTIRVTDRKGTGISYYGDNYIWPVYKFVGAWLVL